MLKTVLFVDDDEAWCSRVSTSLRNAGYEVQTVQDASAAMACADSVNPGLIILDLDLKGEDGLMLMKFLKENHPGVPILLFTCLDYDDESIQSMLAMGADRYLPKQDMEKLIVAVGGYLTAAQ